MWNITMLTTTPKYKKIQDTHQYLFVFGGCQIAYLYPWVKRKISLKEWINKCKEITAKDNNPYYRDEQRAWYDTLRDFLPLIKGLQPTVRISLFDYTWCKLDPNKEEDVEVFKSMVFQARRKEKDLAKKKKRASNYNVRIATVCLESDGHYTNDSRTELLVKLIDKLDRKTDLILLPAGFYETNYAPDPLYEDMSKLIGRYLNKLDSDMAVCLGVDGRYGLDQMAVLFTREGLQAVGRKFYPTAYEELMAPIPISPWRMGIQGSFK